ncbi:MAG: hypothetical protein HXS54_12185 [Theionarchaea archaeon]|nr:hypothetical protein [Theionarchaea archaeon]
MKIGLEGDLSFILLPCKTCLWYVLNLRAQGECADKGFIGYTFISDPGEYWRNPLSGNKSETFDIRRPA